jgi:FtsZ-binding cell division protein ZapB
VQQELDTHDYFEGLDMAELVKICVKSTRTEREIARLREENNKIQMERDAYRETIEDLGMEIFALQEERDAYKGLVEQWVEWSKGAISELSDVIVRLDPKGHVLQGIMEEMPPEKPEGM